MVVDIRSHSTIGDRVRAERERAQLSVDEVAEAAGLSPDRLAAIEAGDSLTTIELDSIARALGIGVHGLLNGSNVQEIFGRIGQAPAAEVDAAVGLLTQFVRDYEFLCSLDG